MRARTIAVRGESTNGRVASAGGPYARRGGAGDVGAYRRAAATKQTAPPPPQPEGRMGLAGDRGVAPPRRSTPGSPSSSRLALASHYPCARPSVLSPRAPGLPAPPGSWAEV